MEAGKAKTVTAWKKLANYEFRDIGGGGSLQRGAGGNPRAGRFERKRGDALPAYQKGTTLFKFDMVCGGQPKTPTITGSVASEYFGTEVEAVVKTFPF